MKNSIIFKKFFFYIKILSPFSFIFLESLQAVIWLTSVQQGAPEVSVADSGRLYYFAFYNNIPSPIFDNHDFTFVRFTPLNLSNDLVRVKVATDRPIQLNGSQRAVITFFAHPVSSSQPHQAPIAEVNRVTCSATNPNCVALNWQHGFGAGESTGHYYGAIYPQGSSFVEIGFKLSDLCEDARRAGVALQPGACSLTLPSTLTDSSSSSDPFWLFKLSFAIVVSDNEQPSTVPGNQKIDSMISGVDFFFQSFASKFQCPDTFTYLPGDGKIFLDTSGFKMVTPFSGGAPLNAIYAVAQLDGLPITGANFQDGVNTFVNQLQPGVLNTPVIGFKNSTEDTNYSYNLSFVGQDAAGIFVAPEEGTCLMRSIQTSRIQGFLPNNTQDCFIATAVYGSREHPSVCLLRDFRDQILQSTTWGQNFIHWYYHWSPRVVSQLQPHPWILLILWFLLYPIQFFAWLLLHPLLSLFSLGLFSLGWILFKKLK